MAIPTAMKGMKRKSSAALAAKAEKKRRTECAEIAKAVKQAEMPPKVTHLLANIVPHTLSVYSDQRHEFQVNAAEMIGQALGTAENQLKSHVANLQGTLARRDEEKAGRVHAVIAAADQVAAKKGEAALKEAAIVREEMKFEAAKKHFADREKEAKGPEREYKNATLKSEELQKVINERFAPLKDAAGTKKQIKDLVAALNKFDVDESLLSTLPAVATKAPGDRGDFGAITFDNLEAALNSKRETILAGVHAAEAAKAPIAATVDAAKASFTAAKEALQRSKEALSAAEGEVSEAQAAEKKAAKANDNFEAEMKVAEVNCEKAKKNLEAFQNGPKAAYASLKATAAPVSEPEPVADEPPVAA